MGWTDEQAQRVRDLLTAFNGAEEVCAVMRCRKSELNALSREAFGEPFAAARDRFHATGRALLRRAIMDGALDGNAKALDMLARDQLGMGPVESRRKSTPAPKPTAPVVGDGKAGRYPIISFTRPTLRAAGE